MRQGRQLHSCATLVIDFDPKVIVVGGRNDEILDTVEILDYANKVWEKGPNLRTPVYMSALVPDQMGKVY